jgi:G:T-mismatch repair DNA endonuclease (very short patch repair protein)
MKCPHEDCKNSTKEYYDLNSLSCHFSLVHKIKYQNWLCEQKLKELNGIWPLCDCGCGEKVSFLKNKFCKTIKGHHHKGKKFPQEVRDKISLATKEAMKKVPKEIRIRNAKAGALARDAKSYVNANKSFYSTQEYHDKMSASVTEALANSEVKKRMLEGQAHWRRQKGPNNFEKIVIDIVSEIVGTENIIFEYLVEGINHKYDIGIKDKKIIIECYGSYWHGDLLLYSKEQLKPWQNRNRAIDKKYEELAIEKGYEVVVIWENKKNDKEFIRTKILEAIMTR